jgi:hypothetical protein
LTLLCVLAGYSMRGGEPAVVGALPEGDLKSYLRCGVSGVALNAPKADADLRSDAGEGR